MRRNLILLLLLIATVTSNIFAQKITPGKEVDLGLPSGTIWAGWNIGATSPEQYGDYYAWGETSTKINYTEETYKFYNITTKQWINIGSNISATSFDVAHQLWGSPWRIPTKEDFDELISQCIWSKYQHNGVDGVKITGPNGNSIFLPLSGYYKDSIGGSGIGCFYHSATLYEDEEHNCAWCLFYCNGNYYTDYFARESGYPIRPVK